MSDRIKTCATCKHWQPEAWVREGLDHPDIPNADHHQGECEVLQDLLEITEHEYAGYGSGGSNGIDQVETPWDFGCNKWTEKEERPP